MKKILKAIAFIVCLVLPLSAMAMSTITDNDLVLSDRPVRRVLINVDIWT